MYLLLDVSSVPAEEAFAVGLGVSHVFGKEGGNLRRIAFLLRNWVLFNIPNRRLLNICSESLFVAAIFRVLRGGNTVLGRLQFLKPLRFYQKRGIAKSLSTDSPQGRMRHIAGYVWGFSESGSCGRYPPFAILKF